MPDRRRATVLDDLSDEIVVDKILVRLPPKDVGRCRAVRRSWRDATSTPDFMVAHHRRQPSLPIIDGLPSRFVVLRAGSGDGATAPSDQELWPFHPNPTLNGRVCLHAASHGLLVVSEGCRFHICNPATRRRALLPQPEHTLPCHGILGLYRHGATGEYRVLWSTTRGNETRNETTLHVLTVGDNESKSIRVAMPSPELEQAVLQGLPRDTHYTGAATGHPPVHHRGNLHWLRRHCGGAVDTESIADIIVFDTEAESFRLMHLPVKLAYLDKLFVMEGKLALYSIDHHLTALNVWVMQDYETEIWAFKFRIDVSTLEASRQLYLTSYKKKKKKPLESAVQYFTDMAVLNEREMLIRFNEKHVLRCDVDGNFLGMVNIGKFQSCMLLTQHRLQESIIPIPPREMQAQDEEAPLSRWRQDWMFIA